MQYVPDFEYRVVRVYDYGGEDLRKEKTEMSLIMLLNRIQDGDFSEFEGLAAKEVDEILRDTPDDVLDVVVGTARSLLHKLNVLEDEEGNLGKLKEERDMGYLFENMKKLDIQEERRKTEEQRQRAETAERKEEEQRQRVENAEQKEEEQRRRADHLAEENRKLLERLNAFEIVSK